MLRTNFVFLKNSFHTDIKSLGKIFFMIDEHIPNSAKIKERASQQQFLNLEYCITTV